MAITDAFRKAVSAGDIRYIRIMMKDSLLGDVTFNEFDEMDKLARTVPGLYDDEHDGRGFEEDRSKWNDGYMNTLMVEVIDNFSIERVEHLKDVVRYLRPVTRPSVSPKPASSRGTKIVAGAAGGGVIGGVIAGIAGGSVIIGAIAGAVVVGAAVAFVTKGE